MLTRWIAITAAPLLKNLAEIWSIPEGLTTFKFFKTLPTVVISSLCKKKKNPHSRLKSAWFQIYFLDVEFVAEVNLLSLRKTNEKYLHYSLD